jgi:hypothetical protein
MAMLGTIIVVIAILWLTLSGLCTAGGLLIGFGSLFTQYGNASLLVMALVIGGIAIGVGLLALWLGRRMERSGRPSGEPPQASA